MSVDEGFVRSRVDGPGVVEPPSATVPVLSGNDEHKQERGNGDFAALLSRRSAGSICGLFDGVCYPTGNHRWSSSRAVVLRLAVMRVQSLRDHGCRQQCLIATFFAALACQGGVAASGTAYPGGPAEGHVAAFVSDGGEAVSSQAYRVPPLPPARTQYLPAPVGRSIPQDSAPWHRLRKPSESGGLQHSYPINGVIAPAAAFSQGGGDVQQWRYPDGGYAGYPEQSGYTVSHPLHLPGSPMDPASMSTPTKPLQTRNQQAYPQPYPGDWVHASDDRRYDYPAEEQGLYAPVPEKPPSGMPRPGVDFIGLQSGSRP